jgi:hypothetical protein
MGIIHKYKVVIAVVLPILILVLIRQFGGNHFQTDAKRWSEPSIMRSNIITEEKIGTLSGEKLIINLGEGNREIKDMGMELLNIPADSVLSKNILHTIGKHDGPLLLYSSETAVSARIWMVLSQMGYKNIFILTNEADNEISKNKFRPDTIVRPEL